MYLDLYFNVKKHFPKLLQLTLGRRQTLKIRLLPCIKFFKLNTYQKRLITSEDTELLQFFNLIKKASRVIRLYMTNSSENTWKSSHHIFSLPSFRISWDLLHTKNTQPIKCFKWFKFLMSCIFLPFCLPIIRALKIKCLREMNLTRQGQSHKKYMHIVVINFWVSRRTTHRFTGLICWLFCYLK